MTRDWEQLLTESVDDVHVPRELYGEAWRAHRRHRSIVLTGAATSVLAVAALTAALVLPATNRSTAPEAIGSAPSASGLRTGHPTAAATGRGLLLAAADVAAARPNVTGRYWHTVTTVQPRGEGVSRIEQWTSTNGDLYLAYRGHASAKGGRPGGFQIGGISFVLTTGQIAALPTDPKALAQYFGRAWDRERAPAGDPISDRQSSVEIALLSLLADVPAPPAVRAAAFRALAQSPNVDPKRSAGNTVVLTGFGLPESKTGQPVTPESDRLSITIDLTDSRLTRVAFPSDTTRYLLAEWVNTLP